MGSEFENLRLSIETMVGQLNSRFEELQQSEQRFRVLVDHAPEVITVYDVDQNLFVDANKNAERFFGCSTEELLKSSPYRFYASPQPDGLPVEVSIKNYCKRTLSGEALTFEREMRNLQGKDLQCEVRLARLPASDRRLIRVSYVDISQRKEAERLLLKNQAHLQTLVRTIPDLIWLKDQNGIFLDCNSMFERFYGAKREAIVGKTDYDFVDHQLADSFRKHDQAAIAAGRPSSNEEWITFADDGHRVLLDTIKTPMFDAGGKLVGVLGIGRDITTRKQAEEENVKLQAQLTQAQKMEAIGTLAGGIAHDFNNILSVMLGYTDMAPDVIGKILDPYFTTKERGKGTGMGLAIIHGIMKEYGGTITIESQLGKGSAFHVYFPVAETTDILETTKVIDPAKGQERILFIDDEELLAEIGKDILERLGYHVTVRRSSIEALTTFQNTPNEFDVVVT